MKNLKNLKKITMAITTGFILLGVNPIMANEATINISNEHPSVFTRSEFLERNRYGLSTPNMFDYNGRWYTASEFFDKYNSLTVYITRPRNTLLDEENWIVVGLRQVTFENAPQTQPVPVAQTPIPQPSVEQEPVQPTDPIVQTPVQPTESVTQAPIVTQPVINERYAPFLYTQSQIQLPNRRLTEEERQEWIDEYWEMGGASAFELEVLHYINIERANYGLNTLVWDYELALASRFFTNLVVDLDFNRREAIQGVIHDFSIYGGSRGVAEFFDVYNRRGANASWGTFSAEETVSNWMNNSVGHRANVLREGITSLGVGSSKGGFNQFGVVHYFMSR